MAVNHLDKGKIPTLASLFTDVWPGDTKEDADCPEEWDSGGSSEDWDGVSESTLSTVDFGDNNNKNGSEDGESDTDEEGDGHEHADGSARYTHNLLASPLLSHYMAVEFNCPRTI
jgi:hypothetical protein